jgi:hypothetical protein
VIRARDLAAPNTAGEQDLLCAYRKPGPDFGANNIVVAWVSRGAALRGFLIARIAAVIDGLGGRAVVIRIVVIIVRIIDRLPVVRLYERVNPLDAKISIPSPGLAPLFFISQRDAAARGSADNPISRPS